MQIRQTLALRKLLIPQLAQSLNILALPLLEIKELIEKELEDNPCLEELTPNERKDYLSAASRLRPLSSFSAIGSPAFDRSGSVIAQMMSLHDALIRQLGMFTHKDEDYRIGQEIIWNIDENGYLRSDIDEIATSLGVALSEAVKILRLIQDFEPAGVAARTISECLLIQLRLFNEKDPLLIKIVESYLNDVAKKNYSLIAKKLNEPFEKIEPLIKRISRLDPRPGSSYSSDTIQRVIPDIVIDEVDDEELTISINNEDLFFLGINKSYQEMLKNNNLDSQAKEFLREKLRSALELLRALHKRQDTLRKIIEVIVEIQADAIRGGLSLVKPLTFKELAQRIDMHESTVCRAVMNKYVQTPCGVVALKNFFTSHIHDNSGQSISSNRVKGLIKELIDREDKKRPLSDLAICAVIASEQNLSVSRRTIAKYREELRILSSVFRKER